MILGSSQNVSFRDQRRLRKCCIMASFFLIEYRVLVFKVRVEWCVKVPSNIGDRNVSQSTKALWPKQYLVTFGTGSVACFGSDFVFC